MTNKEANILIDIFAENEYSKNKTIIITQKGTTYNYKERLKIKDQK